MFQPLSQPGAQPNSMARTISVATSSNADLDSSNNTASVDIAVVSKDSAVNRESRSRDENWDGRLEELKEYHARHGDCLVPHNYESNIPLALWVKRQRYQFRIKYDGRGKKSALTQVREEALNELGFVWDSHQATWEENYSQLVAFKARHGHCNVPITTTDENDKQLAVWVKCQRRQYQLLRKRGQEVSSMMKDRIDRMNSLGFMWTPRKLAYTAGVRA